MRKFLKDTWKVLLIIFIVTLTLLYVLIFDGSEIPFVVSFISAFAILFIYNVKDTIIYIKNFSYLKKSDFFSHHYRDRDIYNECISVIKIKIFYCLLSGGWLTCLILTCLGVI